MAYMRSGFSRVMISFEFSVFFDKEQLIIVANGFMKKDQKTPKKEIERALKIKYEYENEK
jgi:phage-related protein